MEKIDNLFKIGLAKPYEEELLYRLRSYNFNHIPLSILVLSFALCNSNCHLVAIYLTLGLKNYKYVNGNINRFSYSTTPNHSWVECDEYVYDPTECIKYRKDYYYKTFGAKVIEEFDSATIKDYWLYKEALKYLDTDECVDNNIILLLQSLEYLETIKSTKSGKYMLEEIGKYKEENEIDFNFSCEEVKHYINLFKKNKI